MAAPLNGYLQSLLNYEEWQTLYMTLRVERVKPKEGQKSGERENLDQQGQVEQWDVLEGLRTYATDHVLLVGKPGSGKTTALRQLLREEAQNALVEISRGETDFKIPVLLELRDRKEEAIVNRIHEKLRRWMRLDIEKIEKLLLEGRFFLLFDGLNEIPTPIIRSKLNEFQNDQDFRKNPRVFATREMGTEGELNLKQKLTMIPLTELQIQTVVEARLAERAKLLLHQLKDRLQELAETPLLLKILCDVVKESPDGNLPTNRGELFRQEVARRYQGLMLKHGYNISEDSRHLTERLLQQLAFKMILGDSLISPKLQISTVQAEQILQDFLKSQGETETLHEAGEYLNDLLNWNLLQRASDTTQIEFHHQLFQEYYAAEALMNQLPPPLVLKRDYLNYLKWTEPVALMLGLMETEDRAVQVVKLALEVDWRLGARFAGAVREQFQEKTVGMVDQLKVSKQWQMGLISFTQKVEAPAWLKAQLLGETRSRFAIPGLRKLLEDEGTDTDIRLRVTGAFGRIAAEEAIPDLLNLLKDDDIWVSSRAVRALGMIGSPNAIPDLLQLLENAASDADESAAVGLNHLSSEMTIPVLPQLHEHSRSDVCLKAAEALGAIGSETAIPALLKLRAHPNSDVRLKVAGPAAWALGTISSKMAIPALLKLLKDVDSDVRFTIANSLSTIDSETAIPALLKLLDDVDSRVRGSAAFGLGMIGKRSETAIPALLKLLDDPVPLVRELAAFALGEVGSETVIPTLRQLLEDNQPGMREIVVFALGSIGSETAIPTLLQLLEDSNVVVRARAAEALGRIGSETAILALFKLLEHSVSSMRGHTAYRLWIVGFKADIPGWKRQTEDYVSDMRVIAAEALANIGSRTITPGLSKSLEDSFLNLLEDSDNEVRKIAASVLGRIGSETVIPTLCKLLEDPDSDVRKIAAEALGNISSEIAVPDLRALLKDSCYEVRRSTAEALGDIGSEAAIPDLIKLLENKDSFSDLRGSAAVQALEKIAKRHTNTVAQCLPHLFTLITTDSGKASFDVILAIQLNCQFYNLRQTQQLAIFWGQFFNKERQFYALKAAVEEVAKENILGKGFIAYVNKMSETHE